MKIDGDTIKFKSDHRFFGLENSGVKPNTIRILDVDDAIAVEEWKEKHSSGFIEISYGWEFSFKRELIWFERIGVLFGKEIWLFCWKNEKEEDD